MKNGTIVCGCGQPKKEHTNYGYAQKCLKYRPCRVVVKYILLHKSKCDPETYPIVGYSNGKPFTKDEDTWHRVEILVPVKTKTGKGEK